MKTEWRDAGQVAILSLQGPFTMDFCLDLQDEIASWIKKGRRQLALDLSGVDYMDSSGLATLVEIVQTARTEGIALRIFGARGRVVSMMEITGLHRALPLSEGEAEALASLEDMGHNA
jgi:anti-anti-sigma factor